MLFPLIKPGIYSFFFPAFLGVCLLFSLGLQAQQNADTAKTLTINIDHAKLLEGIQLGSSNITKLIYEVKLRQGENLLFCDSAYINKDSNNVEAFGHVQIIQPGGTQVASDYLRYRGNLKLAYLNGDVSLTDGKANLKAQELDYDLNTKIGRYEQGGVLQTESTILSSISGTYNVKTKDSRFLGNVVVTDPQYHVTSEDLGYNTESKIVRFFGPSVVTNDKSQLRTNSGSWDAKNEIAHFTERSSIQNIEQYMEADTLDYNRQTGFGIAKGNVVGIDTIQHSTLYSGYAAYNEITRVMLATINPVMKRENGKDSLFIRADTFLSAPVLPTLLREDSSFTKKDTTISKPVKKSKKGKQEIIFPEIPRQSKDTTVADSTAPRFFCGYHHVLVFSDSLQAKCDSIGYSQEDSILRLMYKPVAWSRKGQITGDTILLFMQNNTLNRIYVPNNALMVSQSGPDQAQLFDQVQGKTLTGYFIDNSLERMTIQPGSKAIYFEKDDNGAYWGVSEAESERMKILFDDKSISKIIFEQEVKQVMSPLDKVNLPGLRLSRFTWLIDQRPKSKEELFRDKPGATENEEE